MHSFILQLTLIGLCGFLAQWLAWRMRVPAIVFLLLTGFIFGPYLHIIQPDQLMGDLLRPIITLAVAIILFEASLNLNFREIKEVQKAVSHIVLIGAPVGWYLFATAAHYIAGLSWPVAVTFGGLLVVTGPTVIIPLLRSSRLDPRMGSVLKWEGIINDPLGVIFAVLSYEYFDYRGTHDVIGLGFYLHLVLILVATIAASFLLGLFITHVLERGWVPEYLKSYFLMILVIALLSICNVVMDELGLVAVTVFGVTLANRHISSLKDIKRFKETVTLLLVSGVFILLTANLDPHELMKIDMHGIGFILLVVFILRPVAVVVSSIGTSLTWKEIVFVSWIAPRGIVCAAIAGMMGPLLVQAGFNDGNKLLPLAFGIVLFTVISNSFTVKPVAAKLGLAVLETGGVIIIGASPWAIDLAVLLKSKDIPVLLADTRWLSLKAARLADIPIYFGEILSEDAEYKVDFNRYGGLLAATDNEAYNSLICNNYAQDLGRERVWQLATPHETGGRNLSHMLQGRIFVSPDMTFERIEELYASGERLKVANIGPENQNAGEIAQIDNTPDIKIGLIRNGHVYFKSPEYDLLAKDGDMIIKFGQSKFTNPVTDQKSDAAPMPLPA